MSEDVEATAESGSEESVNTENNPGWIAAVKKEIVEAHGEDLKQFENINPVLEDYFKLKETIGKAIVKPSDDASEEEIKAYREQMGIPEKPEEYEVGGAIDENFDTWFKDVAFKSGMTKEQAKAVYDGWAELTKQAQEANEAKIKETERELRKELGSDYDNALANAGRIVDLGGEEIKAWLDETGAGNDARFVKLFAKLGAMISEDSLGVTTDDRPASEKSFAERLYPNQK